MGSGPVYKPPRYDANAPDMYVPLMASSTYILLWALLKGMEGDFSPDSMPHKVHGGRCAARGSSRLIASLLPRTGDGKG